MDTLANSTAGNTPKPARPAANKAAMRVLSITTALAAILIALALFAAVDFYEKKAGAKLDAFLKANACQSTAPVEGRPAYSCSKLGQAVLTEDAVRRLAESKPTSTK